MRSATLIVTQSAAKIRKMVLEERPQSRASCSPSEITSFLTSRQLHLQRLGRDQASRGGAEHYSHGPLRSFRNPHSGQGSHI